MSIELKVEDYCQNCPGFEADVDHDIHTLYGRNEFEEVIEREVITTIRCKYHTRCENMMRYLKTQK